jgi:hypothetical protein
MRIAAMLAIGAGVLTAIMAVRSSPAPKPTQITKAQPQVNAEPDLQLAMADANDLALFDSYLASAEESRSQLDAFVEDAGDLEDRFESLSTGSDVEALISNDATQSISTEGAR